MQKIFNNSVLFSKGVGLSEQLICFKGLADKSYKVLSQKNAYILIRGSKDSPDFRAPVFRDIYNSGKF